MEIVFVTMYMRVYIKPILRLHVRFCNTDNLFVPPCCAFVSVSQGKVTVPAGTQVQLGAGILHHSEGDKKIRLAGKDLEVLGATDCFGSLILGQ